MTRPTVTCATCRFLNPEVTMRQYKAPQAGECRRRSPTMPTENAASDGYGFWPVVWPEHDWCGEYRPVAAEDDSLIR